MIADTEVFHKACTLMIAKSLGTRMKIRIAELRRENAELRVDAADAARLRTSIDDANRDARAIRAERDNLERNLDRRDRVITELRTSIDTARELVTTQDQLLAAQRRENESLRAERDGALRDAARRDVSIARGEQNASDHPEPELDDAALRFSLLELDNPK